MFDILLSNVYIHGEMVAKTVLEVVRNEGTQGITLILTLLLKHIGTSEDVAIELLALNEAQLTLLGIHQILRNADIEIGRASCRERV